MYGGFAKIYDRLQDIDYSSFADFYEALFDKYKIKPSLVLDLACGNGNITVLMAKRGYDMTGVDISTEMLEIASEKARENNCDILFLNQDMTEFELYGTVDAVICSLDSINYLTDEESLLKVFKLVKNYLNPDGIFVFDINSEYKLKGVLSNNTYVYDEDDTFCVWDISFNEERQVSEFYIDFFTKTNDGKYIRESEYQEERMYSEEEIIATAEKSGLKLLDILGDRSMSSPSEKEERIFFAFTI